MVGCFDAWAEKPLHVARNYAIFYLTNQDIAMGEWNYILYIVTVVLTTCIFSNLALILPNRPECFRNPSTPFY